MAIPHTSALYYPTIDIKNEKWLRSAILFWDSIKTIVPEGYRNPYSSRLAKILQDEDILSPINVNSDMEEIESLADDVLEYLTDPAAAGVLFGGSDNGNVILYPEKLPREIREIARIHPLKLPYFVRDQIDRLSDDGFARVDGAFASFYMTLLAKKVSERLGLGIVTDSSGAEQLSTAVTKGRVLRTTDISDSDSERRYMRRYGRSADLPREIAQGTIFELMLRSFDLPENISIKELIKFRSVHAEELAILRAETTRLVSDFPEEFSLDALRQCASDQYETKVLPAISSLRRSLRAENWEAPLNGFLKASYFSVPTSCALPQLLHVPVPVALMAGVGVSLVATTVNYVRHRKDIEVSSPYSYLLSIENQFT